MKNAKNIFGLRIFFAIFAAFNCCDITNVNHEIDDNTADTIALSWQLSPECSATNYHKFEVTALHRKFLACNQDTNNSITTFETTENAITLKNLFPFSIYRISIYGIPNNRAGERISTHLEVSTAASKPHFRPRRKSDQKNLALVQAITFNWAEADNESCRLRNGRPSGYK